MSDRLPHPRKPGQGRALKYLGLSMIAVGASYTLWHVYQAWVGVPGGVNKGDGFKIPSGVESLLFMSWLGASAVLLKKAKSLEAEQAEARLNRDLRPPVLLLRSFNDDGVVVGTPGYGTQMFAQPVTLEEAIAQVLHQVGPVIAIGRPGEPHAPLGAAREYVSNEAWQGTVQGWLEKAKLVVMVMGSLADKRGLTWELERVRDSGGFRKLLLVMPPKNPDDCRRRWSEYREFFGDALPAYEGGEILAYFGSGRYPEIVKADLSQVDLRIVETSDVCLQVYVASLTKLLERVGRQIHESKLDSETQVCCPQCSMPLGPHELIDMPCQQCIGVPSSSSVGHPLDEVKPLEPVVLAPKVATGDGEVSEDQPRRTYIPADGPKRASWTSRLNVAWCAGIFLAVIVAGFGIMAYLDADSEKAFLLSQLKEKQQVNAEAIDLGNQVDGVQYGTVRVEGGERRPVAARFAHVGDGEKRRISVEWVLGESETVVNNEIRETVRKFGLEPASVSLTRAPRGVGYVGSVTAKSGERYEVLEVFNDGRDRALSSYHKVTLSPASYSCWAQNILTRDLKEQITAVTDFQPKATIWAKDGQTHERASKGLGAYTGLLDLADFGGQKAYFSATARTSAGRQLQLELEIVNPLNLPGMSSPSQSGPSFNLRWKNE